MIYVSDAWKNAHEQMILPESFVEITMGVMDKTVTGTVSGVNEATFSRSSAAINNDDFDAHKYAFLEHNLWVLDGSMTVMDNIDYYLPPAYVSEDDASGSLTITLPGINYNPIPGFVITWSEAFETYATKFTVTVKNGTSTVGSVTVTDNASNTSVINMPVSGYDSVTIAVSEWSHPDQRNRIDSVMFGQQIVFTKNEIISYSHEQSGSPLGTELSKNSIEFEVDNSNGRWNPLNQQGLAKYLYERQKVTVRYGLNTVAGVEWIQGGVFYLSEWKAPSNGISATFVARDAFEFMLNANYSRPYIEGVTTSVTRVYIGKEDAVYINSDNHIVTTIPSGVNVKIYEFAAWYGEGYGGDPEDPGHLVYRIDQGWVWSGYVSITSNDNLLSDVAKAIQNCVPDDVDRWVSDDIMGVSSPVGIVDANVAEFVQQSMASCGITAWQTADGVLNMASPSTALSDYTITAGRSYSHPEVELSKPLRRVNMVQHYLFTTDTKTVPYDVNAAGEDITVDCPYLWYNDVRTEKLAAKYANWWKQREVVSGEFRADPRMELFDVVSVDTKYGTISPVMITYIKYTYNGSFRCIYEGKVITAEEV